MKKFTLILLLLSTLFGFKAMALDEAPRLQEKRPTIAVVLAGGGGRGMAHVPVLQQIEDAGIPIDIIVGNSMGSIIAGLYAAGYSPAMMLEMINHTDWVNLVSDNPDFGTGKISSKKKKSAYFLRFGLNKKQNLNAAGGNGGLLEGTNVMKLFNTLMNHIPDSVSFDELPIPYACVGTDILTGEQKVMRSGNLPVAMRTSMSIPVVYTPVMHNGRAFVDGGLVNNYPVDVARSMGADIIIGVNLEDDATYEDITNSGMGILLQTINLIGQKRKDDNVLDTDLYIPIDVTGFTSASFNAAAVDSLINRGRHAAQHAQPELEKLAASLHIDAPVRRIRKGEFTYDSYGHLHLINNPEVDEEETMHEINQELLHLGDIFMKENKTNQSALGMGLRFDSKEKVSVLLNGDFVLEPKRDLFLELQSRMGARMGFSANLSMLAFGAWRVGLGYQFDDKEPKLYKDGQVDASMNMYSHQSELYLFREWNNVEIKAGCLYNYTHLKDIVMKHSTLGNRTEKFFSPFISFEINTLNHPYFPTHGTYFKSEVNFIVRPQVVQRTAKEADDVEEASLPLSRENTSPEVPDKLSYTTDNFIQYKCIWKSAIGIGNRFTIIPHAKSHIYSCDETPIWALRGITGGGLNDNILYMNQFSMSGAIDAGSTSINRLIVGCELQQRIFKYQFITLGYDYLTVFHQKQNLFKVIKGEYDSNGVKASYGLRTFFGPINLEWHWNDHTNKSTLFLNLGCHF